MANRKLIVELVGDSRSLERAFLKSSRGANTFGQRMSGVGTTLTRFAKTAAIAVAAAGTVATVIGLRTVKAASDLNEEINKSEVVFGSAARAILDWSKTTSDALGLSQRAALQAAGNFGNMFATIGLGEKDAAAMSRRLVQLGADLASFSNEDPSDMLLRLRSGLAGEAEPLRRFGILLSEARVQEEAWATGIADAGAKLTEQQKVQARYQLILRDSVKAQGDFARTSDSLANAQRRVRASFEDASAAVGQAFLPIAASALSTLADGLQRATPLIQRFNQELSTQAQRALAAAQQAWPRIQQVITTVWRAVQAYVVPVVQQLAAIVRASFDRISAVVEANRTQLARILKNMGAAFEALGKVAVPILRFVFIEVLPRALNVAIKAIDIWIRVFMRLRDVVVRGVQLIVAAIDRLLGAFSAMARGASQIPFMGDKFKGVADRIDLARESMRLFADELGRGIENTNRLVDAHDRLAGSVEKATGKKPSRAAPTPAPLPAAPVPVPSIPRLATPTKTDIDAERQILKITTQRRDVERQIAEQRKAQQFRALGLTSDGSTRVPGAGALRRRLGSIRNLVEGTVLDTRKTQTQLNQIAKVLSGRFGKVGRDVRQSILDMLNDISSALGGGGGRSGPLTKSSGLNTKKMLQGLGLSEEQIRELRGRLAKVTTIQSARRTAPSGVGSMALAGFGGVQGRILVESHTRIDLDGKQVAHVITREQQKTKRRNPQQKRGPNRNR